MPHTATSRVVGGDLRCEVGLGRHTVVTDEPAEAGGDDSAPTPQQLLLAALASCISTTIRMYGARKGWPVGEARVDAAYDTKASPPSFEVEVHLDDRLDAAQRERVLDIASRCPVSRVLAAGARISHRAALSAP